MNLPGFTADSSLGASQRQYRTGPSLRRATGTIPQWSTEPCYDWDCLSYCEQMNPYDAANCYVRCEVPCDPYAPPEPIPAPA